MITSNLAQEVLFKPIANFKADQLCIISGYATPNMASWYMKTLEERHMPEISISLIIGMPLYDGLSSAVHEGFKQLHGKSYGNQVGSFFCNYVYNGFPVRSNLFVWLNGDSLNRLYKEIIG